MKKILRRKRKLNPEEVDLSWQRYLLPPVHPEGVKIIGVALAVVLILGLFFRLFTINHAQRAIKNLMVKVPGT